jgi:hypothetical protein
MMYASWRWISTASSPSETDASLLERQKGDREPSGRLVSSIPGGETPTGVDKTQLTLEFARYLFGENHVFRFDKSEFLHLDNVKFMGEETGRIGLLGEVLSRHMEEDSSARKEATR